MKTLNKIFTYWRDDLKIKNNSRTTQIIKDIKNNPVILYMKGTQDMPMCGFSNSVVQVLSQYGVEFKDVNVLENPDALTSDIAILGDVRALIE